jgi:hypothetical protein
MRLILSSSLLLVLAASSWSVTPSDAYVPATSRTGGRVSSSSMMKMKIPRSTALFADNNNNNNEPNVERMKEIIQEEASNSNMMSMAAEQMKNLTPEQIDVMVRDMETMNPIQKQGMCVVTNHYMCLDMNITHYFVSHLSLFQLSRHSEWTPKP